jgi:Tol biopolymer transport system component/predicted Ser/Thr protein kinase
VNPTQIGIYTIEREVGRGGMGVVYLGMDPKLRRPVAIKVLPDAFAKDPERLARFEREARLLATLTHPNVAGIYGLEEADGRRFLALEYVEGETLAERLERGPLPVDETIDVCRQIASALEAAHEAGVIHRDLKPGNVKLTASGEVKVLDFGLARGPAQTADSTPDLTNSPTVTVGATGVGVIMGTAAYMSPEQARGKPVDRRTDIWSFGCVLYECLTGTQAFAGETVSDMIALILQGEPDGSKLPKDLPEPLRALLIRCLDKDAKQRLRDIGDARVELEQLSGLRPSSASRISHTSLAGATEATAAPSSPATPRRGAPVVLIAAATLIVGAIAGAALWHVAGPRPADAPAMRFIVDAPPGQDLTGDPNEQSISPDGGTLAAVMVDSTGQTSIWLRPLSEFRARPLPDTRGGQLPFWSPDGRYLGFFADGKLKRVRVDGGRPEILCDASTGRGASWSTNDIIVFGPAPAGPLYRVRASGGTPEVATVLDTTQGETAHRWPCFLPDGKHFIFAALPTVNGEFKSYIGSVGSTDRKPLISSTGAPLYSAPGYLIYHRNESLLAQKFDLGDMSVTGDPFTVGDPPSGSTYTGSPGFSVSQNEVLTWVSAGRLETRLVWRDRSGREVGTVDIPHEQWGVPIISPDGRRAVIEQGVSQGVGDVWIVDLEREVANRLTFGQGKNTGGPWSPDGKEVIFQSTRKGPRDAYRSGIDGSGSARLVYESAVPFKDITDWSPDGRWLTQHEISDASGWNLYVLPADGGERQPYLVTPFNEQFLMVAPNGEWAIYVSDESGTPQVYIQRFPEPRDRQQVTKTGAYFALWNTNGREIIVLRPDLMFVSVPVTWHPEPRFGTPVELYKTPNVAGFDLMPGGQKFLSVEPATQTRPGVSVAVNWREGREH